MCRLYDYALWLHVQAEALDTAGVHRVQLRTGALVFN